MKLLKPIKALATSLALVSLLSTQANAATIYIQNVSGALRITGSGSINLANWKNTNTFNFGLSDYIDGSSAFFSAGIINPGDIYEISGPTSFGTIDNNYFLSESGNPDKFALGGVGSYIIAGGGSSTVDFSTFDFSLRDFPAYNVSDIGLTPGTYTYSSTITGDTFDVQIVPEPAHAALLFGIVGLSLLTRRRCKE